MSASVFGWRFLCPAVCALVLLASGSAAQAQTSSPASAASDTPPHMTAKLTSSRPESKTNWWLTPVTVTFTCTIGSTPLEGRCPRPVTLTTSGRRESVSRTITDTDHQKMTVTISRINVDITGPEVSIAGPKQNHLYTGQAPTVQCRASDKLSGIRSCRLTKTIKHLNQRDRVTVSATAIAKSGATATSHFTYTVASKPAKHSAATP